MVAEHGEEKDPGRSHCVLPLPKGAYKKEGEELFIWTDSDRVKGNLN